MPHKAHMGTRVSVLPSAFTQRLCPPSTSQQLLYCGNPRSVEASERQTRSTGVAADLGLRRGCPRDRHQQARLDGPGQAARGPAAPGRPGCWSAPRFDETAVMRASS
jgi:hypothetical protein